MALVTIPCTNCGKDNYIDEDAVSFYCSHCGNKISAEVISAYAIARQESAKNLSAADYTESNNNSYQSKDANKKGKTVIVGVIAVIVLLSLLVVFSVEVPRMISQSTPQSPLQSSNIAAHETSLPDAYEESSAQEENPISSNPFFGKGMTDEPRSFLGDKVSLPSILVGYWEITHYSTSTVDSVPTTGSVELSEDGIAIQLVDTVYRVRSINAFPLEETDTGITCFSDDDYYHYAYVDFSEVSNNTLRIVLSSEGEYESDEDAFTIVLKRPE